MQTAPANKAPRNRTRSNGPHPAVYLHRCPCKTVVELAANGTPTTCKGCGVRCQWTSTGVRIGRHVVEK